jgi:hypothetical protein
MARGIYSFVRVGYFVGLYRQWEHWPRMFCAIVIEDEIVRTDEEAVILFNQVKSYINAETGYWPPSWPENRKHGEAASRPDWEGHGGRTVLSIQG